MRSVLAFLCSQAVGNPAFLEGLNSLGPCPQLRHPVPCLHRAARPTFSLEDN